VLRSIRLGCLIGLVVAATAARAGSGFGVSPLRLELSAAQPMAAFTVTNAGAGPVVVQAQARAWRQVDGQDVNEPTRALLVNPGIVRLGPGESQVVRIALRAAPDRERETGYRMHFTEVPQADANAPEAARLALKLVKRMDVPVFVAPIAGRSAPAGELRAVATPGTLTLEFANGGTGHWRLSDLHVSDERTGQVLGDRAVVSVLPGGTRQLSLPVDDSAVPGRILVKADAGGHGFESRIAVERSR